MKAASAGSGWLFLWDAETRVYKKWSGGIDGGLRHSAIMSSGEMRQQVGP